MARHVLPIHFDNVVLHHNNKTIVNHVTLDLMHDDGITVILGPNGAGKTSFLQLCHGLIKPDSGCITWGEFGSNIELARKHQAMVSQVPVFLRRSVFDNLLHYAKTININLSMRTQIIKESLHRADLYEQRDQYARTLSSGELQRLALARAQLGHPSLMLLDEPTANLDPANRVKIEYLIYDIIAQGTMVLMITHDLIHAQKLAQHLILMCEGKVTAKGSALELWKEAKSLLHPKD